MLFHTTTHDPDASIVFDLILSMSECLLTTSFELIELKFRLVLHKHSPPNKGNMSAPERVLAELHSRATRENKTRTKTQSLARISKKFLCKLFVHIMHKIPSKYIPWHLCWRLELLINNKLSAAIPHPFRNKLHTNALTVLNPIPTRMHAAISIMHILRDRLV